MYPFPFWFQMSFCFFTECGHYIFLKKYMPFSYDWGIPGKIWECTNTAYVPVCQFPEWIQGSILHLHLFRCTLLFIFFFLNGSIKFKPEHRENCNKIKLLMNLWNGLLCLSIGAIQPILVEIKSSWPANTVDPDQIAPDLCLHCLQNYTLLGQHDSSHTN